MVSINWAHVGRVDPEMWVADTDKFFSFPNSNSDDAAVANLGAFIARGLNEAVAFIDSKVKIWKPCNECFKRLPKKRSFAEIWDDPDTWIHYNGKTMSLGFARPGTKEIALGFSSFRGTPAKPMEPNSMQVAATIVHELAHVNGAEGNPAKRDNSAEASLKSCLLTQMFKPEVFGAIDRQSEENWNDTRYIA
ncbi:hypothetical protein EOD42_09410 [Rhodovarius crocodyli]|uniref:Lysine-specific metallo-endopeptidase domain-containing protein n=1 Tax=Rhodovarius crocodyli TaxID=1979269 RepID=A0A437MG76_9PROT|nr:hypothetical protein [Rhodovarius crocodyli]RVT96627.1 hypothetical protein EOD42_09410 [Rhodovarius crocodyli]